MKVLRFGLAATVLAAIGLGSTAMAQDNFATQDGYTGYAAAGVVCHTESGTIDVTAYAKTLTLHGTFGPTPGPYDGGEWMRYQVLAREVGTPTWTTSLTWSPWERIVSQVGSGDGSVSLVKPLGTSVITATPGYNYVVLVQVDFWKGSDYVVNVTDPVYQSTYPNDPYHTPITTGYCHM